MDFLNSLQDWPVIGRRGRRWLHGDPALRYNRACREQSLAASGEDIMKIGTFLAASAAIAYASAALVAVAARAGGDKVVFPENYSSGTLYTTVDRLYSEIREQLRHEGISAENVDECFGYSE